MICRTDDTGCGPNFMRCSARSLVMPHNATSIASGDEITTVMGEQEGGEGAVHRTEA